MQLLAMKRVGILRGGAPHGLEEKVVPPSQHLRITHYSELAGSGFPQLSL
jgi:stearoyl-CoA desaturase (delta-9 desaturase)